MWHLLLATVSVVVVEAAITPGCDYSQTIYPGQVFYVASPNYDASYPKGATCRWIATCPSGYCRADCYDITIPPTSSCSMDKLFISRTGNADLADAEMICGVGATTIVSSGNKLSFGLMTSTYTTGGRFRCKLTSTSSPNLPSCSCGYKKTNRIVGGTETGINEFPMMAALAMKKEDSYDVACGGVIIDKRYVMTAAHCFNKPLGSLQILVGDHDVENDTPVTQFIPIASYITHPLYSKSNNDYDVALVRLSRDIEFSSRVGPVCMPFKFRGSTFANTLTTVLGWGTLFFGGPTSTTLQKVNLNVVPNSECKASVTPRQLCTFYPGKDSCQHDSGGPLLHTDGSNGLLYSIGIVSEGDYCASPKPGINTRVTEVMDWVAANSPDAFYCIK